MSTIYKMEEMNNEQQQPVTMSDKLIALRQQWTAEIESMNNSLRDIVSVDKLLNSVYTKRQKAVDLYYGTFSVYQAQLRIYKNQYAQIYNNLKAGQNNIRYTNETSINIQIESQLAQQKEIVDDLKTFCDFVWETVRTIDNIIFGINQKVKIMEIQNGLKF